MNIDNFSGSSREWVGVKFVYVLPLSWAEGGAKRDLFDGVHFLSDLREPKQRSMFLYLVALWPAILRFAAAWRP